VTNNNASNGMSTITKCVVIFLICLLAGFGLTSIGAEQVSAIATSLIIVVSALIATSAGILETRVVPALKSQSLLRIIAEK